MAPVDQDPPGRGAFLAAGMLLLAGCTSGRNVSGKFPPLEVHQVEQAREALHGGGERLRAHQACAGTSTGLEAFITCMHASSYDFVPREPEYPSPACWETRMRGRADQLPPPHCFLHAQSEPGR